jgi:CelD/BcsL family acetyltransferase involved in cellulose biosynthesis
MSALAERPAALSLAPRQSAASRGYASISVEREFSRVAEDWRALEETALLTPYQAQGWVAAFVATVGRAHGMDFRHVVLRDGRDQPLAILPLVITRRKGIRFAEFIGGKHANYHMGVYAPEFAAGLDTETTRAMLMEIADAIGGLDAFVFVNQPVEWQGVANPMALLAAGPSPSGAYKLALTAGDCDGVLRRAMSSHAHKKLKNKRNRFATFGPSQVVRATTEAEIERVISAFLAQKAMRFAAMGIADPFADPAMRAFLKQAASGERPALQLYCLELAGRQVATYVGAVQGSRFSGMATSFDMDSDVARTSPGEILLIDLIKLQCQAGIASFDLGVGEARYKTTICDERDELVDSFVPVTLKGRIFAGVARAKRSAKRWIKTRPRLLSVAHRVSGLLDKARGRSRAVEE